jgi:dUTPase
MSSSDPVLYCENVSVKPQRANQHAVGLDLFYHGPPLRVERGHQLMVPLQLDAKLGVVSGETNLEVIPDFHFTIETPSAYAKLGIHMCGPHLGIQETGPTKTPDIGMAKSLNIRRPQFNAFAYGEAKVLVTNYSNDHFVVETGERIGQLVCFSNRTPEPFICPPNGFKVVEQEQVLWCENSMVQGVKVTTTESNGNYRWTVSTSMETELAKNPRVFRINLGHYMTGGDPRWVHLDIYRGTMQLLGGIVDADYRGAIEAFFVADDCSKPFTIIGTRRHKIIPRTFLGNIREHPWYPDMAIRVVYPLPEGCTELNVKPSERGSRGFGQLTLDNK